ncbi:polysaccharide biosynthesis protein [Leuconostocaceae bacterium ESL0958]|nr:polysaccharide biosynthesis protein [Leuconostocaceae bacterium ESL0958]
MTHKKQAASDLPDDQTQPDAVDVDALLARLAAEINPDSRQVGAGKRYKGKRKIAMKNKAKRQAGTAKASKANLVRQKQGKGGEQAPSQATVRAALKAKPGQKNAAERAKDAAADQLSASLADQASEETDVTGLADQSLSVLTKTASTEGALEQGQLYADQEYGQNRTPAEQAAEPIAHPADVKGSDVVREERSALLKGSLWLSFGNIVSRILGAAFVLPWLAMLGAAANQGNALFSQGYTIYAILLAVATFGFPSAISKVMAQLIAKKDGRALWALTKQSLQIGTLLGLVFAAFLYLAAPFLANGNANVVRVLHSLAPAVLVFPLMSMVRGIFQGHQLMHLSAWSDIVEQVGRVVYLLLSTWFVLRADSSNWVGAVVQATFAAFIGALCSLALLGYGWLRYRKTIHPAAGSGAGSVQQSATAMVKNILKESWPFVIIGASTNLYLFVDQYTFFPLMKVFFHSHFDDLQVQFALFSANPNKLVMIVISFATSIAATALPILAAKQAALDERGVRQQLVAVLKLTTLVLLPAALGMYAIAGPLYRFFYPIDGTAMAGTYLLQFSALLTIVMSFYMLLAFVLQALSHGRSVMSAFVWGLLVKIVTQAPLLYLFQGMGALIATGLGLTWSIVLMLHQLKRHYQVSLSTIKRTIAKTYVAAIIMAVLAYGAAKMSATWLWSVDSKIGAALATFLGVLVGAIVLAWAYYKMGLLKQILRRGRS